MHIPHIAPSESSVPAFSPGEAPNDTVPKKKSRSKAKKTVAEDIKDVTRKSGDLEDPENIQTTVTYDEKDDTYTIGTTLGGDVRQQPTGTRHRRPITATVATARPVPAAPRAEPTMDQETSSLVRQAIHWELLPVI